VLAEAKYVKRMKKAYDSNLPVPGPEDRRPSLVKIASLTAITPVNIVKDQPKGDISFPPPKPQPHQLEQQQSKPVQAQPNPSVQRLQQEQFDSPEGTPILQRNIPSNHRNSANGRKPTEDVEARIENLAYEQRTGETRLKRSKINFFKETIKPKN